MKTYKDFGQSFIGGSDVGALILAGYVKNEGLITKPLFFGEDGMYSAYILRQTKDVPIEIGTHYEKRFTFNKWLKIYDDDKLTADIRADIINIYRAGDYGCIIELIN